MLQSGFIVAFYIEQSGKGEEFYVIRVIFYEVMVCLKNV